MQIQSVQGQFHDGIDNVPNTGTYLLEQGERVVDNRLNKDLSKVEKVILSHYHSDHTGGLIKLRNMYKKINEDAFSKVYVARGFFNQRYTSEGVKVGPGNFADANDFRDAAEEAGVIFIILDILLPQLSVEHPIIN